MYMYIITKPCNLSQKNAVWLQKSPASLQKSPVFPPKEAYLHVYHCKAAGFCLQKSP